MNKDQIRKKLIHGFAHKNTMTLSSFKQIFKLYDSAVRFENITPVRKKKSENKKN